jgi:hypothetical protein
VDCQESTNACINLRPHTTPFRPLSLVLGIMSTASPRRHTHDSASRYQYYDPNVPNAHATTPIPTHRPAPGPPDRTSSYPPHQHTLNGYHTAEASTSSGVPRRRPPPKLLRKTSITSSSHGPTRHSRSDSSSAEVTSRRDSNASEDYSHTTEHHRSGSSSSRHHEHQYNVHGNHGHHRSHSGNVVNGHGRHGHRRRHRAEPEIEIVEEVVDLEDEEADTRTHVVVHDAEQFWSGQ